MWTGNVVSAESLDNKRQADDRLIIKFGGSVIFVAMDEIEWIEADANYVRLHVTGREAHLFRQTISKMLERLDSLRFLRIHRSYIVNVSRIRALQPCNSGEFIVSLRDGKELPCSRTYRRSLQALYRYR